MIEIEQKKDVDQSTWNISQRKIDLIGDLLYLGVQKNLDGIYLGEYVAYQNIEKQIKSRLSSKEIGELSNIKDNLATKSLIWNPEYLKYKENFLPFYHTDTFKGQKWKLGNLKLRRYLPKYVDYIQSLLLKHGFDIPSKDTTSEELE